MVPTAARLMMTATRTVSERVIGCYGKRIGQAVGTLAFLLLFAASAHAQTVKLAWNANTESDLAGYRVYYGVAPGVYTDNINVGNVTAFTVTGLNAGQPYYFAVKAYNTAGLESTAYSNEVNSANPLSAQITSPAPGSTLSGSTVTFQWASTGVPSYQLSVGTTPGTGNLFDQVVGTSLSASVSGLPTNGSPVYVRLWSLIGSVWNFRDYTYTSFVQLPSLTIGNVSLSEGNSGTKTATFTVTLTPTISQSVTVDYATANGTATAGSDYVAKTGTLSFSGGASTRTLTVTVNGDTTAEPDETFFVNLSNPTNAVIGDSQAVGTITTDDAPPSVSLSATNVNLGASFTATAASGPANPTDWLALYPTSVADGPGYLDWFYLNGTKTAPGSGLTGGTIGFTAPAAGTYNIRFFSSGTYTRLALSGTLTVAAQPTLTIGNATLAEGNSGTKTATLSVTLAPTSSQTVTVGYATANGTATAGSDYVAASGTLTFASGVSTQSVVVTVNGDTTVESDETVLVNLSGAANAAIGDNQGVVTITNDDAPPSPTVSLSTSNANPGQPYSVTVANGPGNSTDWVALYPTSLVDGPGYVDWAYLNGTRTPPGAGLTGGTMAFNAPTTPGTYNVRFFASGTYTRLAVSSTLTVATQPTLTIGNASLTEGNSGTKTATLTVSLAPTSSQTVTVGYATANGTAAAGSDYVAASGTLTFAPGVSTQSIVVTVNGDTTTESDETFFVNLSGATNAAIGDAQGTGTITNDDAPPAPALTLSTSTANPGQPYSVTVANGPGNPTDWVALYPTSLVDGPGYVDWAYLNGIRIPPASGITGGTMSFTAPTAPGTYNVRLFSSGTYTRLAVSGTLTVAAQPTLSIGNTSLTEGNSGTRTATFTVTLAPTSAQTVTVGYATANGTATAGSDYVAESGTLTFTAGASSQAITITLNGDTTAEADETFFVNLSGAINAAIVDPQGTGTITNDDAPPSPTVTVSPTTVNPGAVITATVTNGPGNVLDWVTLAATGAADPTYVAWQFLNGSTVPPAAGLTGATVQFTAPTTPGTYNVRLFANNTFTKLATSPTVTVAAQPALSIGNSTVSEGNSGTKTATFTVALSPTSSQTVTVAYATANGTATAGSDYVAGSGTLTFGSGVSTQTIAVTVNGDTAAESDETFFVNLSGAANATIAAAQGSGTITNDDAAPTPNLTLSSSSVNPGQAFTATVANGAGHNGDWVGFYASAAADAGGYLDWFYLNGSKLPPATGLTGATIGFTAPLGAGTYNVRWFAGGAPAYTRVAVSGTMTVATQPTLTINDISLTEGNSGTKTATFTVTLAPTSTQTVTVGYATANGNATSGSDYVAASGTLTFAAGVSTRPVTVTVNGDTTSEVDETFAVNLSGATNATIGDAQGTATILNDDAVVGAAVNLSSTTVVPGGLFTATVVNGPGNTLDWVTLTPTAMPDTLYVAWKYLNDSNIPPASGMTGGTVTFLAPLTPGTYNVRFLENNSFTKLATSATITIQGSAPLTLTVSATTVQPGAPVTLTIANGPGSQTDWVSFADTNSPDTAYVVWVYLSGSMALPASPVTNTTLQFTAPTTPGTYHFRFFSNNTFNRLATSATVTVQ